MLAELSQALETISERSEHLSHSPRATGENSSPRIPRLAFVAVGGPLLLRDPLTDDVPDRRGRDRVLVLHQPPPLVGGGRSRSRSRLKGTTVLHGCLLRRTTTVVLSRALRSACSRHTSISSVSLSRPQGDLEGCRVGSRRRANRQRRSSCSSTVSHRSLTSPPRPPRADRLDPHDGDRGRAQSQVELYACGTAHRREEKISSLTAGVVGVELRAWPHRRP
jgi:hypothetical protein